LDTTFPLYYNASVKQTDVANRDTLAREAMVHLDHLYRVALYLAKSQHEAEDLVQETFVRALAAWAQFHPGTNMKAWLTKILYNLFFDSQQQKKRWISTDGATDPEPNCCEQLRAESPGPEGHTLLEELKWQISESLTTIPEEFRAPMVLVDMGDFSYEEAAEILSCPIGTIRSRLSRGRKLMHDRLAAYVGTRQAGSKQK
jgi:RNA polymerase sigma-70 factor (ECF subfamily)